MENNKASIVQIDNVRPHCNADRLKCTEILGNNVIIGKDVQIGDVGVFFPEGVQLSEEFATNNNLVRTRDAAGNISGGMFEENRRVKTLKLRGERSEGFWIPISSVEYTGVTPEVGSCFDELNGHKICNKYVSQLTREVRAKNKSQVVRENKMMLKHFETQHLTRNLDKIPDGSTVIITVKEHGTSGRCAKALVNRELNWFERFLDRFGLAKIQKLEYKIIHGSRNVTFGGHKVNDYHGDSFRERVLQSIPTARLVEGEALYFEIVGYESKDKPIMGYYDNKVLGKDFVKKWGEHTVFSYGCVNGNFDVKVYRITVTTPDGAVFELTWDQVKQRCKELGVKHVTELLQADIGELVYNKTDLITFTQQELCKEVDRLANEIDGENGKAWHIREGVCVRVEYEGTTQIFKHKGFEYKVLEGLEEFDPEEAN